MAQKCRFSQRSAATTTSRLSTSPLQSAKPPAGKKKRSLFFGHPRFYSKPNICQDRLGTNIGKGLVTKTYHARLLFLQRTRLV